MAVVAGATDPGIVVFGDVHYARFWDHVARVFEGRDEVVNPNAELRRFVDLVARRHAGAPVVNLGDSIDYYFCDYEPASGAGENNRDLFYETLGGLETYYEIPGNHDYRLYPHNLRFWGLDHINVQREERRSLAHRLGHHALRNPIAELRAVARIGAKGDRLEGFRGFREPAFRRIAGFNGLFLNTRSDALLTPKGFAQAAGAFLRDARARLTAGAVPGITHLGIDSKGLDDGDIEKISAFLRACGGEPVIVFMHAPLINPGCGGTSRPVPLDIDRFRQSRLAHGLAHGIAASGGDGLLRLLRSGDGRDRNIIIVTAHAHGARYFLIDKETLVARRVSLRDFNRSWNDHRLIKHLTILPLGVICPEVGERKTGYGRITHGGFEEIVLRNFDERGTAREERHGTNGREAADAKTVSERTVSRPVRPSKRCPSPVDVSGSGA